MWLSNWGGSSTLLQLEEQRASIYEALPIGRFLAMAPLTKGSARKATVVRFVSPSWTDSSALR
jgi:hypothetical protein